MPDFPVQFAPGFVQAATQASSTLTSPGSANTKGSYTELITSLPYDVDGLLILTGTNSATNRFIIDIAVGGAGSEVVIFPDLLSNQMSRACTWVHLPVSLAAGTRVAGRCSASGAGLATTAFVHLVRGSLWSSPPAGRVVALGANVGTTRGVQIDPGGTINTLGAWFELSSAVPADIAAVMVVLANAGNSAPADNAGNFELQLGVGAAASEALVLGSLRFGSASPGLYGPIAPIWLPCPIRSGARLAARAQAPINDATDRLFDVVVYGLVI